MTPICDPIDRPIITSSGFDVDGVSGIPDFDGNGNSSNPPTINKTINSFVEYTNGDDSTTVQYRYFLESNSGEAVFSANPYIPQEDQSIPGESLNCEVLVTNSVGSTSVTIEMGVVYGLPPSIPENLNSFAIFDPAQGRSVLPNETVTITYNNVLTDPGDPPPHTIETIINGQSFLGTFISFSYDTLDNPTCSPSISRIEISNLDNIIPDTAFVFKNYDPSIQIVGVQGVPGHPCGEPLGSCCIAGELDTETGIQLGSCDQQTNEVCTALGGLWTQETDCPDCNVEENDGLPCCSQYGTGRCCCVQHDNSGLCVDSITYEDCHSEDNVVFANCGGSTEYPNRVWTYDVDCDSADSPPCVGPPTGRCCEFIPDGGGDGIEGILDGFVCTTGLEDGDCPRFPGQSTSWDWNFDGNCPDCRDPTQNNSDCCPTLGRCCSGGSCTPNQLRIDCPQSWDDTSNLCPDCGTDNPGPPCCVATGRCCFKYPSAAGDADVGQRRGSCSIETDTGCSAKFNSLNGIDGTKTFNIGEVCISCVDNTDSCCDDAATNGYACNGINCIPNVLQGAEPSNYVWNPSDDGTCPDCTDPDVNPPNNPSDCCAFGAPLLSIDSFTVDGQPYDATLNPIGVGSEVAVSTTELNVQNVSYRFYITDSQGGNPSIDLTNGNTKTLTVPETQTGISGYLPGYELNFEVTADSQLEPNETLSADLLFHDDDDYIHGRPPVFPDDINTLYPDFRFVFTNEPIDPPITLSYNDAFLFPGTVISNDEVLGIPPAAASYEWTDANDNFISDALFYTISSDGVVENCGLGLQVTLENNVVGARVIPGGAEITKIYVVGSIQGGPDTLCGTPIGRCCVQGNFVEAGTLLSDGQQWGITFSSCSIKDEPTCIADGGEWDDDINDCSVCLTAPPSQGAPCCDEIPGRCCENNSCDDFVLFIDCGGTWTSYMDDTNVCEDACPDAGAACGCATTGACCCGSGFSTPCHDGYTEEECADINFNPCAIGKGGEFQGYGTSCPTDIECVDGDGAADCCPVDEIVSSWTGRVGSPARNTCTTISGNNLADVHRCDGVSREGDRSLQWTSPCDYREILSLPGFADVNPRCEIDSICSCYVAAPLLSNIPYCNGPNTGGRKHEFGEEPSLNLVALCEQKVCASDIFCCDVEWDSTCAKTAQELCGADNIFSGEVDGDELAGAIAESKAVFLNYDNTCSGGPGNFTPCIGTPVYPDQGDYTIIRTWSDCRCNFLHPPASTDHTNCLNGLL